MRGNFWLTVLIINRRLAERKRPCKREDGSDVDTDLDDADKSAETENAYLADSMRELLSRAGVVPGYPDETSGGASRAAEGLADMVHDCLVGVWEGPMADHGPVPRELLRKKALWNQSKTPGDRESTIQSGQGRSDR